MEKIRRNRQKKNVNKVLVENNPLLQVLNKNLAALESAHELLDGADSNDDVSRIEGILDSARAKTMSTSQKILERPQHSDIDKLSDQERYALRQLSTAIESARQSSCTGNELQDQLRNINTAFKVSERAPSGSVLMDIDEDAQLLSWKPAMGEEGDDDVDFEVPNIPESAFPKRNRI